MSEPQLQGITGFSLITADPARLVGFYRDVLGFAPHGEERRIEGAEMRLLSLSGGGSRQSLSLGAQMLSIERFEAAGRPYPDEGDAASLFFQHLALVVADIAQAHARLRDVAAISSDGPQHLPSSSDGVRAFKFRDPDGHPLELLQFPSDKVPSAWRGRHPIPGQIGLGIDHSAISVGDADASAAFYGALGLGSGERTHNHGPEQQRLDGLADAEVEVVPMIPYNGTPHLELLGYRVSKGDRGPALMANDVAATRIVWRGGEARLLRDPDGHLQQVEP